MQVYGAELKRETPPLLVVISQNQLLHHVGHLLTPCRTLVLSLAAIKEAFAADYRLLPGMHFAVVDIASDSSVGQGLVS
jgi:hypothetical protein